MEMIMKWVEMWIWSPFWIMIVYLAILYIANFTALVAGFIKNKQLDRSKKVDWFNLFFVLYIALTHFALFSVLHVLETSLQQIEIEIINTYLPYGLSWIKWVSFFYFMFDNVQTFIVSSVKIGAIKGKKAEIIIKYIDVFNKLTDESLDKKSEH